MSTNHAEIISLIPGALAALERILPRQSALAERVERADSNQRLITAGAIRQEDLYLVESPALVKQARDDLKDRDDAIKVVVLAAICAEGMGLDSVPLQLFLDGPSLATWSAARVLLRQVLTRAASPGATCSGGQ